MPWVRFEDDYLGSKKLANLSTAAIALDMAGIIYSARELRDGQLDERDLDVLTRLLAIPRKMRATALEQLVAVRRWIQTPTGYEIHDYLAYQPSREKVLAQREVDRGRKRSAAGKRWAPDGFRLDSDRIPDAKDSGRTPDATGEARIPDAPDPDPVNVRPGSELKPAAAAAGDPRARARARGELDQGFQPLGKFLSRARTAAAATEDSQSELPDEVRWRLAQPPISPHAQP